MQVRMELIRQLPEIIRESVKPMERIEGIRIFQLSGMDGITSSGEKGVAASGNLADQIVNSALRYRAQAPLLDALMRDIGLRADDLNGLTDSIKPPEGEQPH